MAKTRHTSMRDSQAKEPRSTGTLKAILILTIMIAMAALGLMAWNSFQARNVETLRLIQRDALLSGERLNHTLDQAINKLDFELRSGSRLSEIDPALVGVDAVMGLRTLLSSGDEALSTLGQHATKMIAENKRLSLLGDGRLVLVHVPAVGDSLVATVSAEKWMPATSAATRLILYGDATASFGNKMVLPPDRSTLSSGRGFRYAGLTDRSATACVGLAFADFTLCQAQKSPLLTLDNGLDLLLCLLLLAAPSLAVFGLYNELSRAQSETGSASSSEASVEHSATNAAVGFWEIRTSEAVAWINEEAARLLGLSQHGELSLLRFMSQIHSTHRQFVEEAIAEARPSRPFSLQFATAMSGGETWMEIRGSQIYRESASSAAVSGAIFDATESARARERQKTAESKLRSAIETFPSPFALWDHNKRLTFWNKSFELSFGLESVVRKGIAHETMLLARSGQVINERASAEDTGVTLLGLRSGKWIKLVERSTPAGGMISFGIDVTHDVLNEEQLNQQKKKLNALVQKLERSEGHNVELARKYNEEKSKAERSADSKSAFLANMSHELRTPLNAINGFSEILVNEMYGPLGDRRYGEYARDILASGQHLLDMINDILDIAKIEAGKMTIDPKPIDLVDPVDAAVRMIRRKAEDKGIQLSLQSDDALPHVEADHRAVRQMVLNLLSNAIKFTDAGGRIVVAVQRRDDFLRVAVRDSGVGIPKEHLPRLAQPFEQVHETRERNYEGTGLGLALTKSFAEMHGGRFHIASELGKGTMVSFYLPVAADASSARRDVA